jgi:hypothetical protein
MGAMKDASHQLDWLVGGVSHPKPKEKTRKQNRAPPSTAKQLPLFDGRRWLSRRERLEEIRELNHRRKAALKRLPLWADVVGFHPTNESPPQTRGECPDTTKAPCPYIKCRMHLYRNDAPAGRPGLGRVPRGEKGHTQRVCGDFSDGDEENSILDGSAWVSWEPRPSCALALIEKNGPMSNQQVADVTGRHRTLIARLTKTAAIKAIRVAQEMGIEATDFIKALQSGLVQEGT